jgi:hypothetical protein
MVSENETRIHNLRTEGKWGPSQSRLVIDKKYENQPVYAQIAVLKILSHNER